MRTRRIWSLFIAAVPTFIWVVAASVSQFNHSSFSELPPQIIPSVRGFELVHIGFDSNDLAFLSIDYAAKSPYEFFTYKDETFIPTKNSSILVRRNHLEPTRFQITEKLLKKNKEHGTQQTMLIVSEKASGKQIATRRLTKGQIENETGWVGDHAIAFIRKVFDPALADRGPIRYWDDSKPLLSVKLIPVIGNGFKENIVTGCPINFQISMDGMPNQLKLNTPDWRFIPLKSIKGVFCSSDYVAVVSSTFPGTLIVDILTKGGRHLSTTEIGIPGDLLMKEANVAAIKSGKIINQSVLFEVEHAIRTKNLATTSWVPYQRTQVNLTIPEIK